MPTSRLIQPIRATDEEIEKALDGAHLHSLLPALAHLTRDPSILRPELRPCPSPVTGLSGFAGGEAAADAARGVCLGALIRFRDAGSEPAPAPSDRFVRGVLEWMSPDRAIEEYVPLVQEELSAGRDRRAPCWDKQAVAPSRDFSVAVIGAGMSGLLIAHRLRQAGVPFLVVDKNDDVGGTWFDNHYPGCRVDVPNTLYCYSFAQGHDWPQHYSTRRVLHDYFRRCADEFGLLPHIRFRTEVRRADWVEDRSAWRLRVRDHLGREEALEANVLVSAVGQLNRPLMPRIPGMERFAGPLFHSARWDHTVRLDGKRVAVIGTGASAAQLAPAIARRVEKLSIFQRTPNWIIPTWDHSDDVSPGQRWLFGHVPHLAHWHRLWVFWWTGDGILLPRSRVDPTWPHQERSVSAANDDLRAELTSALEVQLGDRPDLLAKAIPSYPPASKRHVVDNGAWAAMLRRPNVDLITAGIREVMGRGVVTADGALHEVDVIACATGFQASRFLTPMRIVGRRGIDLHEQWGGRARAFLGIAVPNFPNLFCLYGPNTNLVVNGSTIFFAECQTRYILNCIRLLLDGAKGAIDCRQEVHDAYNDRVESGNLEMAWGVSKVNSWYKNEGGCVTQNWPFTLLEYWQRTLEVNPADYRLS